jgi:hypothetical protein
MVNKKIEPQDREPTYRYANSVHLQRNGNALINYQVKLDQGEVQKLLSIANAKRIGPGSQGPLSIGREGAREIFGIESGSDSSKWKFDVYEATKVLEKLGLIRVETTKPEGGLPIITLKSSGKDLVKQARRHARLLRKEQETLEQQIRTLRKKLVKPKLRQ